MGDVTALACFMAPLLKMLGGLARELAKGSRAPTSAGWHANLSRLLGNVQSAWNQDFTIMLMDKSIPSLHHLIVTPSSDVSNVVSSRAVAVFFKDLGREAAAICPSAQDALSALAARIILPGTYLIAGLLVAPEASRSSEDPLARLSALSTALAEVLRKTERDASRRVGGPVTFVGTVGVPGNDGDGALVARHVGSGKVIDVAAACLSASPSASAKKPTVYVYKPLWMIDNQNPNNLFNSLLYVADILLPQTSAFTDASERASISIVNSDRTGLASPVSEDEQDTKCKQAEALLQQRTRTFHEAKKAALLRAVVELLFPAYRGIQVSKLDSVLREISDGDWSSCLTLAAYVKDLDEYHLGVQDLLEKGANLRLFRDFVILSVTGDATNVLVQDLGTFLAKDTVLLTLISRWLGTLLRTQRNVREYTAHAKLTLTVLHKLTAHLLGLYDGDLQLTNAVVKRDGVAALNCILGPLGVNLKDCRTALGNAVDAVESAAVGDGGGDDRADLVIPCFCEKLAAAHYEILMRGTFDTTIFSAKEQKESSSQRSARLIAIGSATARMKQAGDEIVGEVTSIATEE